MKAPYRVTINIMGGERLTSYHRSRRAAEYEARHHGHGTMAHYAEVCRHGVPLIAYAWTGSPDNPQSRWARVVAS